MVHRDASVREVHRALGVGGKTGKEVLSHLDHLVRLLAHAGHLSCDEDVLRVAEHSPEGVARKRSRGSLLPGHRHACVQSSGQGHGGRLPRLEIPREVPRENVANLSVVLFRLQEILFLPRSGLKVCPPPFDRAISAGPRRAGREHVDALEERAVV